MRYRKQRTRKTGKCERCCPTGGAIFHLRYDYLTPDSEEPQAVWKCCNCGLKKPYNPQPRVLAKPTAAQEHAVARLLKVFGGTVEKQEIQGKRLWVSLKNNDRKWYEGQSLFGQVGAGGALELTLLRMGGDVKITDWIGVEVYCKTHTPQPQA